MKDGIGSVYEEPRDLSAETRRLQELGFPLIITQAIFSQEEIHDHSFYDIGAGPDIRTETYVEKSGGIYVPVDIRLDFLKKRPITQSQPVVGSATELPFANYSMDICHTRFVLMHLPPELQKQAICESLRCMRRIAAFIEYDWTDFKGAPLINEIRDTLIHLLSPQIDFFLGRRLRAIVEPLVDSNNALETKEFSREYGDYRHELLPLLDSAINLLKGDASEGLISLRLALASAKAPAVSFSPPSIISVTVHGGNVND